MSTPEESGNGVNIETTPVKVDDPTLFRTAQKIQPQVSDSAVLKSVVDDAAKYSFGEDVIDKKLFEFIEQYQEIKRIPFSVEYYGAKEIYAESTSEMFKSIDKFIVDKLKEANQKTTFDAYNKLLKSIEKALGLTPNSETMHRIEEINKFIKNGTRGISTSPMDSTRVTK